MITWKHNAHGQITTDDYGGACIYLDKWTDAWVLQDSRGSHPGYSTLESAQWAFRSRVEPVGYDHD